MTPLPACKCERLLTVRLASACMPPHLNMHRNTCIGAISTGLARLQGATGEQVAEARSALKFHQAHRQHLQGEAAKLRRALQVHVKVRLAKPIT